MNSGRFNLCRLNNELRAKQRQCDAAEEEAKTLRGTITTKDRALERKTQECAKLADAKLKLEGKPAPGSLQYKNPSPWLAFIWKHRHFS